MLRSACYIIWCYFSEILISLVFRSKNSPNTPSSEIHHLCLIIIISVSFMKIVCCFKTQKAMLIFLNILKRVLAYMWQEHILSTSVWMLFLLTFAYILKAGKLVITSNFICSRDWLKNINPIAPFKKIYKWVVIFVPNLVILSLAMAYC